MGEIASTMMEWFHQQDVGDTQPTCFRLPEGFVLMLASGQDYPDPRVHASGVDQGHSKGASGRSGRQAPNLSRARAICSFSLQLPVYSLKTL
jgi:hypothetical protein